MKRYLGIVAATAAVLSFTGGAAPAAEPYKIAHVYGKTGPYEVYAKQSQTGLMMGIEYETLHSV